MVVVENAAGLFELGIKENCNPKDAETFEVAGYLLERVTQVLKGEREGLKIASYDIDLEESTSWSTMPKKIKIAGQSVPVSEEKWFKATLVILRKLGLESPEPISSFLEDLEKQRWPKETREERDGGGRAWMVKETEEMILSIDKKNFRGELLGLEVGAECELVMVAALSALKEGKVIEGESERKFSWQILVRRKKKRSVKEYGNY